MKLLFNPASPFARKVRVAAHELGVHERIEPVVVAPLPIRPVAELASVNPLGKVPCLVLDDGTALYDSRVIAEYLDGLVGGGGLFPPAGSARWTALRRQALGDGMMDAGVAMRYERAVRPAERQFSEWIDGQLVKIRQALDTLEQEAPSLAQGVTIGHIAIGCALGYLDFRFPEQSWRSGRAALAEFYDRFSARPSMTATTPPV